MGLIESIRKWVDGEGAEDPLLTLSTQTRPRRVWEEFLIKVAREVESVMQREMFTPPGGKTYIPPEYIVYLSKEDDRDWQGDKRRGLEQGLFYVLSERARELSGTTKLATESFAVELRIDGTLAKGEFRVQPVWDPTESGKTAVSARTSPDDNSAFDEEPSAEEGEGEETKVRARPAALYSIEVWRNGVRQSVAAVTKPEITIGRGSRSIKVDLAIKGDPEVSRHHATLTRESDDHYFLTAVGRNATTVNGREISRDERVPVLPDQKIEMASFTLRIQPS